MILSRKFFRILLIFFFCFSNILVNAANITPPVKGGNDQVVDTNTKNALASSDNSEVSKITPKQARVKERDTEGIIGEYKDYLGTVPQNVREEVKKFREASRKLQEQKRNLYNSLSHEAQDHLKHEQSYKKKLPIEVRKKMYNASVNE